MMSAAALHTLLRAGLTSGSIMSVSDVIAQIIGGAFCEESFDLVRTGKYFWLGVTADGPFWETAFRVMERIFGAVEGPGGSVRWGVLARKTMATQLVCNPIFLALLISYTAVLDGPRTLQNVRTNLRAKLWPYLRDGFVWWSLCNTIAYRFVPPGRRLMASGIAGLFWSTYFSWVTRRIELKQSQEPASNVVRLTPQEFAERFHNRRPLPKGQSLEGLCGRFIRGTEPKHFDMLSDEPGKRLSWVCSSKQLGTLLGKSPCEAMMSIGFRVEWLAARQKDGTKHMLVVFPAENGTIATWKNLWMLIRKTYGSEVDAALRPFRAEIEQLVTWPPDDDSGNGYAAFDPAGELQRLSDLPVAVKYEQAGFLTAERLLAADPKTLYHARGFLEHSVGCNCKFTGTGLSPDGEVETLVPCVPLSELVGLVRVPLTITDEELHALQRR